MSLNITKHVSFPPALFAKIEMNASSFGVSFAEYLRHLAMNDSLKNEELLKQKKWENGLPVCTASEEKWEEWSQAKKEKGVTMTAEEFKSRRHYV